MEKELIKLQMKDMTRDKLYKLFGIKRVKKLVELEKWLGTRSQINLNKEELIVINIFQKILLKNIENWNENDLSLGFIGPIINMVDFKVPYTLNFFTQRPLKGVVGDYEIVGKPDGIIASGEGEPETPYFKFHVPIAIGNKKDIDSSGDPAGQNLAAMLIGQTLNKDNEFVYGCYVVGRFWYFMVLKGKEFAISNPDSYRDTLLMMRKF